MSWAQKSCKYAQKEQNVFMKHILFSEGTKVEKMKLDNCKYVDDDCLVDIYKHLKYTIHSLHVSRCPRVTDKGFPYVAQCRLVLV